MVAMGLACTKGNGKGTWERDPSILPGHVYVVGRVESVDTDVEISSDGGAGREKIWRLNPIVSLPRPIKVGQALNVFLTSPTTPELIMCLDSINNDLRRLSMASALSPSLSLCLNLFLS